MGPLEVTQLTLGLLAGDPITLLDLPNELITFTLDNLPVIVSEFTPLLLRLSDEKAY
jgi:hypothetical protein